MFRVVMLPLADYRRHAALACALAATTFTNVSIAGGFYLPHFGAPGLALSSAGSAARADDASTVFSNPAGMTHVPDGLQVGVSLLTVPITIDPDGSTASTPGSLGNPVPIAGPLSDDLTDLNVIPSVFLIRKLTSRDLWLGLAVTSPFGSKADHPRKWFGRYDSVTSDLLTLDIAPSIAYRVNNEWSIGGGINLQFADATLTNAVVNPLNPGGASAETDAFAVVEGDDWSTGFNIGATWQPTDGTRLGLHYRSPIKHVPQGDLTNTGFAGPLSPLNGTSGARTEIKLPEIVSIGLSQSLSSSTVLHLDANWFGWSRFDELRITTDNGSPDVVRPQNFKDSWFLSAGVTHQLSDQWKTRMSIGLDESPTVDEWRNTSIPDADKILVGLGFAYELSREITIDFTLAYAEFDGETLQLTQQIFAGSPLESVTATRGRVSSSAYTVAVGVQYRFGQPSSSR